MKERHKDHRPRRDLRQIFALLCQLEPLLSNECHADQNNYANKHDHPQRERVRARFAFTHRSIELRKDTRTSRTSHTRVPKRTVHFPVLTLVAMQLVFSPADPGILVWVWRLWHRGLPPIIVYGPIIFVERRSSVHIFCGVLVYGQELQLLVQPPHDELVFSVAFLDGVRKIDFAIIQFPWDERSWLTTGTVERGRF